MRKPAMERLRELILRQLDRQGVTQAELALLIGRSQKHVSQTLTGACGLTLPLAEKMLAALGAQLVLAVVPIDREVTRA